MTPVPDLETLGRKLWGEPNRRLSTRTELRFGSNGSKSIALKKGTWFDHESNEGGGYLELYEKVHGARPSVSNIVATYDYHTPGGDLAYQVVRTLPKSFFQRRPNGAGGWRNDMKGQERFPYRLPELARAAPDAMVFIPEGEKDVDALAGHLLIGTTNPGGACKFPARFAQYFRGRQVCILPDNDEVGKKHALDVAAKLKGHAASIRILFLPHLPEKGDVSDWFAAGGTADELERLAAAAPIIDAPTPDKENEEAPKYEAGPWVFVKPAELQDKEIPERKFVVSDWIPFETVTIIFGDGGVGKSLLVQQLMTSAALGLPWLGLRTSRCRSLALFCEDDHDELHRRQHAINRAYGIEFSTLEGMEWVSGVGHDNLLVEFDSDGCLQLKPKFLLFMERARAFEAGLIVIDTAADTFGGNENVRREVRQFVGYALGKLAHECRAAVVLNAHPSRTGLGPKGDLDGGSTAWSNTARTRLSLTRPEADGDAAPDRDERILTRRKANYAATGDTIKLRWQNGVLVPVERPGRFAAVATEAEADIVFLALLAKVTAEGQPASASNTAGNFAPKMFARRPDRQGFNRRDFEGAMLRLFASSKIRVEEYGRAGSGGRPRRLIAVDVAPDE